MPAHAGSHPHSWLAMSACAGSQGWLAMSTCAGSQGWLPRSACAGSHGWLPRSAHAGSHDQLPPGAGSPWLLTSAEAGLKVSCGCNLGGAFQGVSWSWVLSSTAVLGFAGPPGHVREVICLQGQTSGRSIVG